jgi:hypothetical protein
MATVVAVIAVAESVGKSSKIGDCVGNCDAEEMFMLEAIGVEIGVDRGIEIGVAIGIEIGVGRGIEIGVERGIEIGVERGVELETETGEMGGDNIKGEV